jgi:hypothetical protein
MKTTFEFLGILLMLASATASAATDAATNVATPSDRNLAFIYDMPIEELDPIAMESTRGGLGPLALALGIAGVDLAFDELLLGYLCPSLCAVEATLLYGGSVTRSS